MDNRKLVNNFNVNPESLADGLSGKDLDVFLAESLQITQVSGADILGMFVNISEMQHATAYSSRNSKLTEDFSKIANIKSVIFDAQLP